MARGNMALCAGLSLCLITVSAVAGVSSITSLNLPISGIHSVAGSESVVYYSVSCSWSLIYYVSEPANLRHTQCGGFIHAADRLLLSIVQSYLLTSSFYSPETKSINQSVFF